MSSIPQIKTLQEYWREYRDTIYPDGISAIQNKECHQAFFSCALIILAEVLGAISSMPEDQGVAELQKLHAEALQYANQVLSNKPKNKT